MADCKNCFLPIDDLRKETHCSICNAPLHKDCAINDGGAFCDACYTVKTEDDTISIPTFIIPDVIRRSYIELYRSCPYAFYLEVIKGLDTTCSSFARIGIDLHELLEKACKYEINMSQLIKEFNEMWEAYDDSLFEPDLNLYSNMDITKLRAKLLQQSYNVIDTFFSIVLPTLPKEPFALEKKILFDVGEDLPKVSITMDRIDEVDGELEVSDWKTGALMVGKKLSSDLQAPLYIYAIREHFKKPVRKFTLYYLSENKTRSFVRVDTENYVCTVGKREYKINLTDAIREVQSVFSQIKKNNFNIPRDTRGMYFTCKTCSFKKNEQCQGADIESWKQHK